MEWVGEAHNAGVRYVLRNVKIDPKKKPDQAAIKKLATEYFGVFGITGRRTPFRFQRHPDTKAVVKSIQKKGIVTHLGAEAVSTLLATLQKKLPLPKLLAEIERQEHAVTGKLRGSDLLFFQGMAAVARHSAKLWAPVSEGGEDFGHVGTGATMKKPIDWHEVVHVDCAFAWLGIKIAVAASVIDIIIQILE
jgi:hypothetical protein